ncbi:hypothetical protein C8F04DRAFT_1394365 [Mycena alexandri]|uniref:RING-type domain-containing protein n=1 Tax=Mycena alexandri TaxID=1745969 RepID=A0AAD6X5W5_9AGAR|nr:hypothetical protein C8F04DRAFT_1244514 [Mycena alexandri]KAJ7036111.1 hypothetical protein C8F04DRAFT_1394365 [Mycena alexandri]
MTDHDPDNDDIVLLDSTTVFTSKKQENEELKRQYYAALYPLVKPPYTATVYHAERFETVRRDFATEDPTLPKAKNQTATLFESVWKDVKEDLHWVENYPCPFCYARPGRATIVLSCACRHSIFHLSCIRKWHYLKGVDKLLPCPVCQSPSKPVHIAWLVMSEEEK